MHRSDAQIEPPLSAVMGPGAHYEGDLSFEGRVRVDGHFTGRIYSEDLLELGADGVIEGEADVARALIAGTVLGRLRVRERLVIEGTGRIEGKLDAGICELRPGAVVRGEVRIRGEEVP
ncbi:MAG: polymer-forming cytoskeletal protein [Myxococcota bacterium]|nr:polymer-forming cytoskeletal protein [Myxococcota bacterium]